MQSRHYHLPARAPAELWVLAIALGVLAISLTPDNLIALGPMDTSLTSDNDVTRQTALTTVRAGRASLALGALGLLLFIAAWCLVTQSRWVARVCRYDPPAWGSASTVKCSLWLSTGAFLASLGYVALAPLLLTETQQDAFAREDGLLEQATAFLFLAASILSFMSARERAPREPIVGRRSTWHVFLGIFFLFCFGEEISWGQRLFDFETPQTIKEINVQGETNLHNMMGYLADHLFIVGMFVYGAVLPLLASRYDFWRRSLYWVGIPVPSMGLAIGFALASGIHDWTLYRVLPQEGGLRAAELREALIGLCCMLLMLECFSRQKHLSSPSFAGKLAGRDAH